MVAGHACAQLEFLGTEPLTLISSMLHILQHATQPFNSTLLLSSTPNRTQSFSSTPPFNSTLRGCEALGGTGTKLINNFDHQASTSSKSQAISRRLLRATKGTMHRNEPTTPNRHKVVPHHNGCLTTQQLPLVGERDTHTVTVHHTPSITKSVLECGSQL